MLTCYFDLETTDVYPNSCETVEFGAIIVDETFDIKEVVHMYINPKKHISEGASRVHKLTNESLKYLTEDYFEDVAVKIQSIFDKCDYVAGYCNTTFDNTIITRQLVSEGLTGLVASKNNDVFVKLKQYYKSKNITDSAKLESVLGYFLNRNNLLLEDVQESFKEMLDDYGISLTRDSYHSALFDTYCTMFIDCLLHEEEENVK